MVGRPTAVSFVKSAYYLVPLLASRVQGPGQQGHAVLEAGLAAQAGGPSQWWRATREAAFSIGQCFSPGERAQSRGRPSQGEAVGQLSRKLRLSQAAAGRPKIPE